MAVKTILVVEDEQELRELMISELQREGYFCTGCDNFNDAFHLVTERKFDLLTLDLQIVDGKGVDLARWVRKSPNHPNYETPIMIISGSLDGPVIEFLKDKVQKILAKPVGALELIDIVNGLLEN